MMPLTDLFGVEIPSMVIPKIKGGYAAPPGSGPLGETCRTCKHYRSVPYHNKRYRKCSLTRPWTHGPGSDIKAKTPACRWWTFPDQTQTEVLEIARPRR